MASPAKKQKVDSSSKSPPIVFKSPGINPDVSIKVFDAEFHVHSLLLKLHSAFFRKFLDSPDKIAPSAPGTLRSDTGSPSNITRPEASALRLPLIFNKFKYSWVTKVDEGDGKHWHLVAENPKNEPYNIQNFNGDKELEEESLKTLLCAIYNRRYVIKDTDFLVALADLADYYRALPIVSRTLSDALLESHGFVFKIGVNPIPVYEAAARLRHKVLFREALIWIAGNWLEPEFDDISDRRLRQIARSAHSEIARMVSRTMSKIMIGLCASGNKAWSKLFRDGIFDPQDLENENRPKLNEKEMLNFPQVFRNILNRKTLRPDIDMNDLDILTLLENRLVLDQAHRLPGEVDNEKSEDYFLCAAIEDADLPWDLEELEW